MTVRVYRSTDASAPTLTGIQGTWATVLTACLVTGYGSQTAAGWSNPYNDTNVAVLQPSGGNQLFLRIDETFADQYGRALGFETMSTANIGTGMFPASTQAPLSPGGAPYGVILQKSSTFNATARPWIVIATESFVYFWVNSNVTSLGAVVTQNITPQMFFFGTFDSLMPDDNYNTIICGSQVANATSNYPLVGSSGWATGNVDLTTYVARHFTQLPGSCRAQKVWDKMLAGGVSQSPGRGGLGYTQMNGRLYSGRMRIIENHTQNAGSNLNGTYRGNLPGLWLPVIDLGGTGLQNGDIVTNVYDTEGMSLAGRVFMVLYGDAASALCVGLFEISDTW